MHFPQLEVRNFWREIDHPELNAKITYPGGFVKPGIGDCGIRFRAPLIGEHNDEVYKKQLGFTNEEMIALQQRRII
jgi:crotonobetainyl-CoA:carnitine CoA-transferase CaiB-like acyl-CoA transferase